MTREERLLQFPPAIREFLPRIWDAWNARKAAEPKRPYIEHSWTAEERQTLIDGVGRTDADLANELGLPMEQIAFKRFKLRRSETNGAREWLEIENEAIRELGSKFPLRLLAKVFKADPQNLLKQMKVLDVVAYVTPPRKTEPRYPAELLSLEKQVRSFSTANLGTKRLLMTGQFRDSIVSVYRTPDEIIAELSDVIGV